MRPYKNRIGIMTFHNAINYGAVLQAYALSSWLISKGYECEIIDYSCESIKNQYKLFCIYNKTPKGVPAAIVKMPYIYIRRRKFQKFAAEKLCLSKKKYRRENIKSANSDYSVFITGSDQVWNLTLTGFDKSYFLDFADSEKKCLSYAASIGKGKLSDKEKNVFERELERFNCISVRENEAKNIVENITQKFALCVLDPVFLPDTALWEAFVKENRRGKYIFVYCLHEKDVYKTAEKLAHATKLHVVCVTNEFNSPIKAEYLRCAGVEEFVSLIANAEYVVTDSFHGAALSVIFRKNLKIVMKKQYPELNGRLKNLTEQLNLTDTVTDINASDENLAEKTSYDESCNAVKAAVEKSRNYLLKALGEYK